MRRPIVLLVLAIAVCAAVTTLPAAAAPNAQATQQPCLPGELCIPNEGNITTGPGTRRPVSDPPGAWVRSLVVLSLIGLVMSGYVAVALGGKRLPIPFRRRAVRV